MTLPPLEEQKRIIANVDHNSWLSATNSKRNSIRPCSTAERDGSHRSAAFGGVTLLSKFFKKSLTLDIVCDIILLQLETLVGDKRLIKLVGQVLGNPKDINFDDLRRLLEGFGFECHQPRSGSSHYTFRKTGSGPITVPKKKPVNAAYVRKIIKLLYLGEWYEENS
jgi:predicted RNA binding protein YcfA (HicA-like mRNA interferase family)